MSTHTAISSNSAKLSLILTFSVVVIWNVVGTNIPILHLSENQSLYIYSSAAQVIAAVYGLTVAGYGFLRTQQDRLIDKDETLVEIISRIQLQQHNGFILITWISGLAIIVALLAIALREVDSSIIRALALNTASALFMTSLAWTALFVADALRPEKIIKASESIKEEITAATNEYYAHTVDREEPHSKPGNLGQFLKSFNEIERRLEAYAERYFYKTVVGAALESFSLKSTPTIQTTGKRLRWTKIKIIRALVSQKLILPQLANELMILVKYRNALVHGNDLTVSDDMVERVISAKDELLNSLAIPADETNESISPETYDWGKVKTTTGYSFVNLNTEDTI